MQIYLDESGDLGWKFDEPYRQGGSSRYLSLAFLFLPIEHRNLPKKIIKKLYKKYRWVKEKKASDATSNQKLLFCEYAIGMLNSHPNIKIDVIVVKKTNVQPYIRTDSNKLYNYMSGLVIPDYVCDYDEVEFMPDERSIKVESGNSLIDYLQLKLWFEHNCSTKIINTPIISHKNYNLQFVDWITCCVWEHYEDSESEPIKLLRPHINIRQLYF